MEFISHTEYLEKTDHNQEEIRVFFGGRELSVAKGFRFGPYSSDFFDVHYCKSGAIDFLINDKIVKITAGMLYIIPPHTKVEKFFKEDTSTIYITIKGSDAEKCFSELGFSRDNVIFPHAIPEHCIEYLEKIIDNLSSHSSLTITSPDENLFPDMITAPHHNVTERRIRRKGLFFMLIADLMELRNEHDTIATTRTTREEYIDKAIKYIEANYNFDINVDSVAKYVGLNRSYLYSLFRESLGLSVQEFIIRTRINAACYLLQHYDTPIKSIAASVRYDPVNFPRIFKKVTGMTANEYRKKYKK